jgi:hypothetical protein
MRAAIGDVPRFRWRLVKRTGSWTRRLGSALLVVYRRRHRWLYVINFRERTYWSTGSWAEAADAMNAAMDGLQSLDEERQHDSRSQAPRRQPVKATQSSRPFGSMQRGAGAR